MSWRLKRTKHLIVFAVSLAVAFVTTARADIINVPGDFPTIQEAIDAAVNGDEVLVAPGTYNELIDFLGKAITVHSSDGPDVTTIDAQGLGSVVTCDSAEGPDSVLEGFTITGGNAFSGGGMYNENSSPTVNNCWFTGNTATNRGGGMFNSTSSPTVNNCIFTGNNASSEGGGMKNFVNSNPSVTNCFFSNNIANNGGGMQNQASSPAVTNCTFTGNEANATGGGMRSSGDSNPVVTNCTFSENTAAAGGGMYISHTGNQTVTNTTFSGNIAANTGGGMYNSGTGNQTVTNCTFSDNIASECPCGGGGIFIASGDTTVSDTVFCDNFPSVAICGRWIDGGGNDLVCPSGACCLNDTCIITDEENCIAAGGTYQGNDTTCDAPTCPTPCPADLDGSGDVGVKDLLFLLGNWGPCPK